MTPEGLVVLACPRPPKEAMDRLAESVAHHGMTVFARIDHAAAAKDVGMTLAPTEVLIFGNPKGGTLLMQAAQTLGIDLPLKALVWQDGAGKTWIGYNDPRWLAKRHGVTGYEPQLDAMTKGLEAVAKEAC
ncbi:MAG TPA: DUF302 domain-containing protein [Rhizomicrobium sp.]|nr:DUF302 domain-containing protein [Rhizomicrobium sp.]